MAAAMGEDQLVLGEGEQVATPVLEALGLFLEMGRRELGELAGAEQVLVPVVPTGVAVAAA
jgi:hypothetical protein